MAGEGVQIQAVGSEKKKKSARLQDFQVLEAGSSSLAGSGLEKEGLDLAPSSCLLSLSGGTLSLPGAQGRVTTFPSIAEMAETVRMSASLMLREQRGRGRDRSTWGQSIPCSPV